MATTMECIWKRRSVLWLVPNGVAPETGLDEFTVTELGWTRYALDLVSCATADGSRSGALRWEKS